jgi:hypothetical protein
MGSLCQLRTGQGTAASGDLIRTPSDSILVLRARHLSGRRFSMPESELQVAAHAGVLMQDGYH